MVRVKAETIRPRRYTSAVGLLLLAGAALFAKEFVRVATAIWF